MKGTNLTLLQIEKSSSQYTAADKTFFNFLCADPVFVINNSIVSVAQKAGISEATITRFSRKAGFKGFNELKLMLSQGQIKEEVENTVGQDIFSSVAEDYGSLVKNSLALIEEEKLLFFIEKLQTASRVKFYGVGSSGYAAKEIVFRMVKLNISAFCYTEGHYMKTDGALSRQGELIVALSLSGLTSDVSDALKAGRENGAFGVAITNYEDSPLAKEADLILIIPTKNHFKMGQVLSPQLGILFLFDCIIARIISENPEKYYELRAKVIHTVFRSGEER